MSERIVTDAHPASLNRAQLERILGAVGDAITVQDPSGAVVYANDRALANMGIASVRDLRDEGSAAIVSRFEILDEGGRPFPIDELPGRRALDGRESGEVLVRYRSADGGTDRWARVSAEPITGPDGSVELVVNTFRDVTAQRAVEAKTRFQSELLDQAEAAVVSTDARGIVNYWNEAASRLLRWNGTAPAGVTLADLLSVAPSTDPTGHEELPLGEVLSGGRWEGEALARATGGTAIPVYVALSPVDDAAHGVVGAAAVMLDLSERRAAEARMALSEERYRTLADSLPHIVWTAGPDGSVTQMNRRFSEYTGVSSEAGAGWAWTDVIHPEDLPGMLQRWTSAIETGRPLQTEFRLRRADGAYRWHMSRGLPLRDDTGNVVSWIGTSTDIEDRVRAERGFAFLAEASAVLNDSLDYEETLSAVARLAVPRIADWCRVDLVDQDGRLQMVAAAHADPAKVALAVEVNRRWPVRPEDPSGVALVMRTGESQLVEEIPAGLFEQTIEDVDLRSILLELGVQSSMTVPLMADGHAIGAISFVAAESGRHFDRTDLALVEDLSRRATAAIENALLYQRVSQFKGALDNATDCVFMYDPATLRFTYVNRGAVDQVGYSAEELMRMTPLDLKPEFDEEGYRALVAPLIAGELGSRTFETVQRRKDGILIPVDVVLQRIPIVPDGLRVIAFVRDVSERVETQARLRRLAQAERTRAAELDAVIRAMGEAVIVFDADGLVTLSNPAADALFSDAVVARWQEVVGLFEDAEDDLPALGSKTAQGPVELRLRSPQRRWVEVTAYPVLVEPDGSADFGTAAGVGVTILVMRDITAQREASAMREAFVGVLSHELRTPVTTIFGSSKVLERAEGRLTEDARREIYADIAAESERLYRLVEDLLILARYGDAPLNLGDEPVLLQRILPGALAAEQARWPDTEFVSEIAAGLPTVRADATYVEQVARNLLGNAAKYSRRGVVTLSLEPGVDEVVVRVTDNGPGFPPDEADRLFELFYRSPLTAAHASGAGIGLFVCRRLIEAMGGRIWAQNRPEGGAEFGFTLRRFTEDE